MHVYSAGFLLVSPVKALPLVQVAHSQAEEQRSWSAHVVCFFHILSSVLDIVQLP